MKRKNNISLIFVSLIFLISISIILHNVSAEEFNAKELGLKFEYDESWKLHGANQSNCDLPLCVFKLENINNNNTSLTVRIQQGDNFKNECKCESLVEFVQYDYTKYYEPIKTFSLINDNQTTLNANISAMQMEYTSLGGNTQYHYLISWIKNRDFFNNDIFYKLTYQSDNNNFYQYLSNIKNILNSIELFDPHKKLQSSSSKEVQPISEKKKPSFMIPNEKENEIESLNQQQLKDQQQLQKLKLTTYKDPRGKFTLEYDPSIWIAIPNNNRFDGEEVAFVDKKTAGDETALVIGFTSNSMPNKSIKQITKQLVPTFLNQDLYIDRQLEEGIECGKMKIQENIVCKFVYSQSQYSFNSYPRNYFMMFYAKIGNELLMGSFTSLGNQFDYLEQKVIQMINSMKMTNSIKLGSDENNDEEVRWSPEVLKYEEERIEAQKSWLNPEELKHQQKRLEEEKSKWSSEELKKYEEELDESSEKKIKQAQDEHLIGFCAKRTNLKPESIPMCQDPALQEAIQIEVKKLKNEDN
ncbi:MAG: hypothetical protein ACE5SW_10990 [Nitrososphaeraceae archaeon]